ncbi:hypothetical protein ACGFZQ_36790 [Streptomyces sp. NPDC048254]|uniref:hypothetical protein n=1 Tax=Streptomyces sp. NPDC048254 TaxID=3365525 RepID=UPI00371F4BBC
MTDFLQVPALRHQPQHVDLAAGQTVGGQTVRHQDLVLGPAHLVDESSLQVVGEVTMPLVHPGDALAELLRGEVTPPQDRTDSVLHSRLGVDFPFLADDDQDTGSRKFGGQLFQEVKSRHVHPFDGHHHDVGVPRLAAGAQNQTGLLPDVCGQTQPGDGIRRVDGHADGAQCRLLGSEA